MTEARGVIHKPPVAPDVREGRAETVENRR